jgi:hypothetical protein
VSNMAYMFYGATAFNQVLCWNITGANTLIWLDNTGGATHSLTCAPTDFPDLTFSPSAPASDPTFSPSAAPNAAPICVVLTVVALLFLREWGEV